MCLVIKIAWHWKYMCCSTIYLADWFGWCSYLICMIVAAHEDCPVFYDIWGFARWQRLHDRSYWSKIITSNKLFALTNISLQNFVVRVTRSYRAADTHEALKHNNSNTISTDK